MSVKLNSVFSRRTLARALSEWEGFGHSYRPLRGQVQLGKLHTSFENLMKTRMKNASFVCLRRCFPWRKYNIFKMRVMLIFFKMFTITPVSKKEVSHIIVCVLIIQIMWHKQRSPEISDISHSGGHVCLFTLLYHPLG